MKKCFKCNIEKPLSEFYKHSQMKDGHVNKCKKCNKKDVSENYQKNIDYYRAYEKTAERRKSHNERQLANQKKYRSKNNKKYKVHGIVARAMKSGKLVNPRICEKCGSKNHIVGHHDDYDKPLEVRWLCQACHIDWHSKNQALNQN